MKTSPQLLSVPIISLTVCLFLAACGKPKVTGFYAFGDTGYNFASDGTVKAVVRTMPNAGASGTYVVSGETITLSLANGSSIQFKSDSAGLHDLGPPHFTYALADLNAFLASAPKAKPAVIGNEKTF